MMTREQWESRRVELRQIGWNLLGDLPDIFAPPVKIISRTQREGFVLEKIHFENGAGADVFGYILIPDNLTAPAPAILYNHYHGGKYFLGKSEMLMDRATEPAIGIALVKQGYVVLAIDAYLFGERQQFGNEVGKDAELSLFKKFLWEGRTLWGMMVRDDLLALNYFVTRPEVDPARIGTTGMSLGGSRATWLAALDDRIKVLVPVAQMTRYHHFAESNHWAGHGIYYYVPGMLKSEMEMEWLVALAAPHPQLILIGDSDPLSPIAGVREVEKVASQIYGLYGAPFQTTIEAGVGHVYTSSMYRAMLDWFAKFL